MTIEQQVAAAIGCRDGRPTTAQFLAWALGDKFTPQQVACAIGRLRHKGAPIMAQRDCCSGAMLYTWQCLVPGDARTWWYILPGEERARSIVGPGGTVRSGQAVAAVFAEHGVFPVSLWPFRADIDTIREGDL